MPLPTLFISMFVALASLNEPSGARLDPCPPQISLDDALALADARPIVAGYTAAIDARRQMDQRISRLHGNTQAQISSGVRWWPTDMLGVEGSVGISHQARLADLGGTRRALAERERAVLAARGLRERHMLRIEIAMAWVDLAFAAERAQLMSAQQQLAEKAVRTIRNAHALGAASRAELLRAEAERISVSVAGIDAEGEAAEARLGLAARLGCRAAPTLAAVGARVRDTVALQSEDQIKSVDAPVLDALAAQSAERSSLASLQQRPWLNLGVSSEVDGRNTARTLATVGGTWALFEGSYLARARERAERALLIAQKDEAKTAERALFDLLVHDIEHLSEKAHLMRTELLPKLQEIERLERAAVEAGEANSDVLLRAQYRRRAAESATLFAERDFAKISVRAALWTARRHQSEAQP